MSKFENSKRVFGPYWNGSSNVYADPFRVVRVLTAWTKGELAKVVQDCNNGSPDLKSDARDFLLQGIHLAFEMQPFDPATGDGILEDEAFDVYHRFSEWTNKKKVTEDSGPSCSPPSVEASST